MLVKEDKDKIMNRIKLIQLVKEVIAEQKTLNEGPLATQVLKTAKDAIEAGSEVTIMGKTIGKIVVPAGAFFPTDGGPSIRISNLENPLKDIMVDGEPIDSLITLPEPAPIVKPISTPSAGNTSRWTDPRSMFYRGGD